MTITLSPQIEARVHKVAQMIRQSPDEAVLDLLNQALSQAEYARHEIGAEEAKEVLSALQQSADDFVAGRSILLEDYEELVRERRQARDSVKDTL